MPDYYELDFLDVGTKKSGDAITIRYQVGNQTRIHVVDGGFQETGPKIVSCINDYYGSPSRIDHLVVTHGDADHVGGLADVIDSFDIGELWMLRPWLYAAELLPRFARYSSADALAKKLKEAYSALADLEKLATDKKIPIRNPLQGASIGVFRVLAPSKARYLDLIVESDKTPQAAGDQPRSLLEIAEAQISKMAKKAASLVKAIWGEESFPVDGTAPDNEMSVVQYGYICNHKILLTGDAGRLALSEAAEYAPIVGLALPGINKFQVPHHGSRHNVSSELLDKWLGKKLSSMPIEGSETFTAITSAAKDDEDHPRKSVIRALRHRGALTISTKGKNICCLQGIDLRPGWSAVVPDPYPTEQEA